MEKTVQEAEGTKNNRKKKSTKYRLARTKQRLTIFFSLRARVVFEYEKSKDEALTP